MHACTSCSLAPLPNQLKPCTTTMASFQTFLLSNPEFLLAVLSFLSFSLYRRLWCGRHRLVPVNWPVVGMLPYIIRHLHHLHGHAATALREVGCTFMFRGPWLLGMNFLVTCDPAAADHCLNANFKNYHKGRDFAEMFDILGDGILVAAPESWARQRAIVAAVFSSGVFRSFVVSTAERLAGRTLLPFLDLMAARGREVELEDVFMRFSLDASYTAVFAADLDCLSVSSPIPAFGEATRVTGEAALFRHVVPLTWWKLVRWLNVGIEKKLAEAKVALDEFIYQEIAKRKAQAQTDTSTGTQGDLLSMYMNWPMDPGVTEDGKTRFLRDVAVGFIFAGKDLTAAGMTWFFYTVCKHPHVEAKILDELRALLGAAAARRPDGPPHVFDCDTLRSAVYLHAAILETLRLFPPSPFEETEARGDDVLPDGTRVAGGTRVVFSIYAMGRLPSVWGKDCMEFMPERWLSKSGRIRHEPTYKFLAFNTGPRSCLGKDLALSNMKIAAAAILYNFHVELVEGHVVVPQNSVVLHTKYGMKVRVKRREAA